MRSGENVAVLISKFSQDHNSIEGIVRSSLRCMSAHLYCTFIRTTRTDLHTQHTQGKHLLRQIAADLCGVSRITAD